MGFNESDFLFCFIKFKLVYGRLFFFFFKNMVEEEEKENKNFYWN